jgi:protein-L-isoaspartate O-methyltransferase
MSHADVTHTENVRRVELELIADELKTTDHVLEIGGGSGYQAAAISGYV